MDSIFKCCCGLAAVFMFCFITSGNAQEEAPAAPPHEEEAMPADEMKMDEMKCEQDQFYDKDLKMCMIKKADEEKK